ncbi:hypothetical protein BDV23DRAFT_179623 [Aspergillus alliaceus]|uniref:Pyridoxal phosphate-dependent transferase n=1 Tax=Petromyces alliaceus TaxID=209559 RepID=A0A5N7CJT1_PETAA|nr:hypothetical protein BDV23DRAFT_179623 [Aspergillus alliaceus]
MCGVYATMEAPWLSANPQGIVILHLAENSLLHDEMGDFIKEMAVLPINHLTYSTGSRRSRRISLAAATFLAQEFQWRVPITQDNIFITSGVAGDIDALNFAACNEGGGAGIVVRQPYYNNFNIDIVYRTNGLVIGVTYKDIEGYSGLDDLFCPAVIRKALEPTFRRAQLRV